MFGIDDSLLGAGIGAVGSIATGWLGSNSNADAVRETNATNLEIARENNAFNQQMWNENNAYNTPSAQVQRDLAAGLNPYLTGTSVGNATSSPVVASPVQKMEAPQPGNGMLAAGQAISSFGQQMYQSSLMSAQVKSAQADAVIKQSEAALVQAQTSKTLGVDTASVNADIANKEANTRLTQLYADNQTLLNAVNKEFATPVAQANLSKITAEVANTLVNTDLSKANIDLSVSNALESAARAQGIYFDVHQKSVLLPYLINQFKLSNQALSLSNQGASISNALQSNELQFQNSVTMPNNSFGMRQKAASLKSSELGVQLGGINIDKAAAETNNINENSKLVRKENQFYVINALGKLIPLTLLVK